jgi:hypothetical protein
VRTFLVAALALFVVSPALAQHYPQQPPYVSRHGDANPWLDGRQGDGRLGHRERERLYQIDERLAELYHRRQRIAQHPDRDDWRRIRRIDVEMAQLSEEKRQILLQR